MMPALVAIKMFFIGGWKILLAIGGGITLFLVLPFIAFCFSDCYCMQLDAETLYADVCNHCKRKQLKKQSKLKFIINFWSMKFREWKAALTKSQKFLKEKEIEAKDKIAELDRKIKDKEAEFERLAQVEKLNVRGYQLDKREAELAIEAKNVGYIETLQVKIKDLEARIESSQNLAYRLILVHEAQGCKIKD